MNKIIVVGSLSLDLVLRVARIPSLGETIIAQDFAKYPGGKGNNQAIAASRSQAITIMIGNIGQDEYGQMLKQSLIDNNVNTEFLYEDSSSGTGLAFITINADADNSIVIAPRSNSNLTPALIAKSKLAFTENYLLMLQLETPIEASIYAAQLARQQKQLVLLNPAPAPASGQLPRELMELVDFFLPNQSEAFLLTGIAVKDVESAKLAALNLLKLGPKNIIITMGDLGVFALTYQQEEIFIPAFKVKTIDTTAAGDAFCGAFAACYLRNSDLILALKYASAAGALATTKSGAVPSLPEASDILQLLS